MRRGSSNRLWVLIMDLTSVRARGCVERGARREEHEVVRNRQE